MKCEVCTFIFNAGFCKLFGVCYNREFLQLNDVNEIKRMLIGSAEKKIDKLAATKGKRCEACKLIFTAEFCNKFGVCYNREFLQHDDEKEVERILIGSEEKNIEKLPAAKGITCKMCQFLYPNVLCKLFGICHSREFLQNKGSEEKKINELSVDPLECPLCEMSVNIISQMIRQNMTKV